MTLRWWAGCFRPASTLPKRPYRQHRIKCKNLAGKAFYLEYNWRLVRELSSWKYDIVCAVDVDTLAAGAALTRGNLHKLVFDAHEWFHMTPEVVDRNLIRGFWKGLAKMLMPKTDLRYTVAPMLAEKLGEDYGFPFETIRSLPWRNPAPPPPIPDRKIILYQGMLNPGRGLEVAIAAMDSLPDCELWIAGSGPEEEALRRCSEKLQEAGRVKFLGFVEPADLPALTRKAWLGLNLLESSSPSYYYSLANKALDYVQAGVPSVQMNFPEYALLAKKFGCYLLLEDLAVEQLVTLIQSAANDPPAYQHLQDACLAAREVLCWEREEAKLLDVWNDL